MAEQTNTKFVIIHKREECIGCGACESVNPGNWTLKTDDGLASCVRENIDDAELKENMEAADVCPIHIIHIKDNETGKELI